MVKYGNRVFVVMAARLWNALSSCIRKYETLTTFKNIFKTYLLFIISYIIVYRLCHCAFEKELRKRIIKLSYYYVYGKIKK